MNIAKHCLLFVANLRSYVGPPACVERHASLRINQSIKPGAK
jgi:hypothetical protein